jgi:molecular chaperone Hsp33
MSRPQSTPPSEKEAGLEVRTWFVRERNALLAQADFGPLYVDYYLHLADYGIKPEPEHDAMFKRALAGFVLHCASRPWNEMTAWTINFQRPLVNLFLAGDNEDGSVTGRVFTDNVKEMPENLFFADVIRGKGEKRRSSVSFAGNDPFVAFEEFYRRSEQRAARFFDLGEESFALMSEHPDCDLPWFEALTPAQVKGVHDDEETNVMERRIQRWHCGCNQSRMLQVLAPAYQADADGLFEDDPVIEIRCPRCASRHNVTREAMEAYVAAL